MITCDLRQQIAKKLQTRPKGCVCSFCFKSFADLPLSESFGALRVCHSPLFGADSAEDHDLRLF